MLVGSKNIIKYGNSLKLLVPLIINNKEQSRVQMAREYAEHFVQNLDIFRRRVSPILGGISVAAFFTATLYEPSIWQNYSAVAVGAALSYVTGRTVLTLTATACYASFKGTYDLLKPVLFSLCKMSLHLVKYTLFLPYHVFQHRTLVLSVALLGALAYFNSDIIPSAAMPYINQGISIASFVKDFVTPLINSAITATTPHTYLLIAASLITSLARLVIEAIFEKTEQHLPIKLTVKNLGTFDIPPQMLPKKPEELTEKEFHKAIGRKIARGHKLCNKILNGNKRGAIATQKQISNLMWYLQVKAEQKAGPFDSGSISIQDSKLHLLNFLDSNKEVYQRLSSHIKEFQAFETELPLNGAQGKSGVHRGIDFNNPYDLKTCLPYGMLTLMVAPMFADTGLIKRDRILLKMEEHGAWISRLKKKYKFAPASRPFNRHDISHALGHGFGFIKSQYRTHFGDQTAAGTRRERVPKDLTNEYNAFIKEFKQQGKTKQAEILERNKPLSTSGGIRIMASNLYNIQNFLTDEMCEFFIKITQDPQLDHPSVRIGNEVILDQSELS